MDADVEQNRCQEVSEFHFRRLLDTVFLDTVCTLHGMKFPTNKSGYHPIAALRLLTDPPKTPRCYGSANPRFVGSDRKFPVEKLATVRGFTFIHGVCVENLATSLKNHLNACVLLVGAQPSRLPR